MADFDSNDKAHQEWRAKLEELVGIALDPAISLDVIDLTEEKRPA